MNNIFYQIETNLSLSEFRELLVASTLGERRPVDNPLRLEKMLCHANLIITARDSGKLVGIARSLTDQSFCTYLSDLAVHRDYQQKGIGKELVIRTKQAFPQAKIILLSAPKAVNFYPKIGMTRHDQCFILEEISK
ncbi:MAG: GNAT family N-acetyltransferase [Cyclobacteriaceae bacterium]